MMSIEESCRALEGTDNSDEIREILHRLPYMVRNIFAVADDYVTPQSPKYPLAQKIQREIVAPGMRGLKIVSWNVNSLRAGIVDPEKATCKSKFRPPQPESPMGLLMSEVDPDIICLQETKLSPQHTECFEIPGYHQFWSCSTVKKGYSGVSIWSKMEPIQVTNTLEGLDERVATEGRVITAYYDNFVLVTVYVPNTLRAGNEPLNGWDAVRDPDSREERKATYNYYISSRRNWDQCIMRHLQSLQDTYQAVILCGDLNVARGPLDIYSGTMTTRKLETAKADGITSGRIKELEGRVKSFLATDRVGGGAGYRLEEREGIEEIIREANMVDAYRDLHPDTYGFTFWDAVRKAYRTSDNGLRLDYFLVSKYLMNRIRDVTVLKDLGVIGMQFPSDHAPVVLQL